MTGFNIFSHWYKLHIDKHALGLLAVTHKSRAEYGGLLALLADVSGTSKRSRHNSVQHATE